MILSALLSTSRPRTEPEWRVLTESQKFDSSCTAIERLLIATDSEPLKSNYVRLITTELLFPLSGATRVTGDRVTCLPHISVLQPTTPPYRPPATVPTTPYLSSSSNIAAPHAEAFQSATNPRSWGNQCALGRLEQIEYIFLHSDNRARRTRLPLDQLVQTIQRGSYKKRKPATS